MKKITRTWVIKAEEDFSVATGIVRRRRIPSNTVCFLCQQSAEKYLKGLLQENEVVFSKTHDLVVLHGLAQNPVPQLEHFKFVW